MLTRKNLQAIALGCAIAVLSSAHADDRSASQVIDDATITSKVKAELFKDPSTKALEVDVTTRAGAVELSGFVDSAAAKQSAEQRARTVGGVRSVTNNLQVGSGDRTAGTVMDDGAITVKIKARLADNPATRARNIDVETNAGVVQLTGSVDSQAEKRQAEVVARSIGGVKDVRNDLSVAM